MTNKVKIMCLSIGMKSTVKLYTVPVIVTGAILLQLGQTIYGTSNWYLLILCSAWSIK
jgi:hypothetical protein